MTVALNRQHVRRAAICLIASAAVFWTAGLAADTWKLAIDKSEHACLDPYRYFLLTMRSGAPEIGSVATFRTQNIPLYADDNLFTKRVIAGPGAKVRVDSYGVSVDGAEFLFTDQALTALRKAGVQIPFGSSDEFVLEADEFFMAGTNPLSYDSRYYGPIHASQFVAQARPLW